MGGGGQGVGGMDTSYFMRALNSLPYKDDLPWASTTTTTITTTPLLVLEAIYTAQQLAWLEFENSSGGNIGFTGGGGGVTVAAGVTPVTSAVLAPPPHYSLPISPSLGVLVQWRAGGPTLQTYNLKLLHVLLREALRRRRQVVAAAAAAATAKGGEEKGGEGEGREGEEEEDEKREILASIRWAEASNKRVLALHALSLRITSFCAALNSFLIHTFPDADPSALPSAVLPLIKQRAILPLLCTYLQGVLQALCSMLPSVPAVILAPLPATALIIIRRLRFLTPSVRCSR